MKRVISVLAAMFSGSAQAATEIDPLLERLGRALVEKRPEFAQKLRPPLSASDIAELEQRFTTVLPDTIKALYMWHDGQDPRLSASFANNMVFLPLEEALSTKAEFDGMIGYDFELENWWHPGWLPVFSNGGGAYLVVDQAGVHTGQAGQLVYFFDDYESRPIVAPSLEIFLTAATAYYEETPAAEMKESYDLGDFLPKTGLSFKAEGEAKPLD